MDTIRELEKNVLDELRERLKEYAEIEDQEVNFYNMDEYDVFHEIADSNVPIYNYDLLQLASDNIFLAVNEPELGPAFDGSHTPINIIAANVYEYLQEYMLDNIETVKEEIAEELLDEESEDE